METENAQTGGRAGLGMCCCSGPSEGAKLRNCETARCVARCCVVTQGDATVCNTRSRPAVGAGASAVFFPLVPAPSRVHLKPGGCLFLGCVSVDCDCVQQLQEMRGNKDGRSAQIRPCLENESRGENRESGIENRKSTLLGHLPPRPPVDAVQTSVGFGVGRLCRAAERTGDATLLACWLCWTPNSCGFAAVIEASEWRSERHQRPIQSRAAARVCVCSLFGRARFELQARSTNTCLPGSAVFEICSTRH